MNVFASVLSWILILGLFGVCVYQLVKFIKELKDRKKEKKGEPE